jgi:hypothetical protein
MGPPAEPITLLNRACPSYQPLAVSLPASLPATLSLRLPEIQCKSFKLQCRSIEESSDSSERPEDVILNRFECNPTLLAALSMVSPKIKITFMSKSYV